MRKQIGFLLSMTLLVVFLFNIFSVTSATAEEAVEIEKEESVKYLDQITVIGKKDQSPVILEPEKFTIDPETYKSTSIPQNVGDILKDFVIMDYRGESALVPEEDTLYMRGFSSRRFVTSLNGSAIRNMGGYGVGMVDYALLPPFLIDSIEVLPGPHSALYPGQAVGGVVNFKTGMPKRYETVKPDISVSTSYGSYNTQNHNLSFQGGSGNFIYDMGYQKYFTNGYLRNNETDIDTIVGRVGCLLPNNGYITLTASCAYVDRERTVINDPDNPESNYNGNYPEVSSDTASYYSWQSPKNETTSARFRLDFNLPTSLGTWKSNAYFEDGDLDSTNLVWTNAKDHSKGLTEKWNKVYWRLLGGQIANEFQPFSGHIATIGGGIEQMYNKEDSYNAEKSFRLSEWDFYKKRHESLFAFFQDKWEILPRLSLTAGLRYESNTKCSSNYVPKTDTYYISGEGLWYETKYVQWVPKSFLSYELDDLADVLRDTSVSVGISRIWREPGPLWEAQSWGIPNIGWLEPEHGIGYDLIFSRRLAGDIQMQLNYSYSQINDYICSNHFTDDKYQYMINLDEVIRQGIELQFTGNLTDSIDFRLGWAWQDFENKGDESAGKTELEDRAKHRVNAGLSWKPFEKTTLIFDYEYQDAQVAIISEEINPGEYVFHSVALDSYHVVDFAVEHQLFDKWHNIKNAVLKLYVKNLFDKEYEDINGYRALDFAVGGRISFNL
jgi:iron complex outermembrane receptor protein